MPEKKEYRSSIRSRRLIREAMVALLKEKDISKITVKSIVERADLNRATFYAHYPDVRGVMEEFENETIARLREVLAEVQFEKVFHNPTPLFFENQPLFGRRFRLLPHNDLIQHIRCFFGKIEKYLYRLHAV